MFDTTFPAQLQRRPTARIAHGGLSEVEASREIDMMTRLHSELTAGITVELKETLAGMPREPVTQTLERANDLARARISTEMSKSVMTLRLDLHPGDTLVGAPFDEDWHVGTGLGFGRTGSLGTVSGQAESTCGAAIILTNKADTSLYVSVTPVGTHKWSWIWADAHRLTSRGGIAMLARRIGEPQPAFLRRVTLWNVFGDFLPSSGNVAALPTLPPVVLGGDSGEGAVADAKETAVGPQLFSGTVGPASFYIPPGERFIVWLWLWQVFAGNDKGFLAVQTADLTAFRVTAAPPVIVH